MSSSGGGNQRRTIFFSVFGITERCVVLGNLEVCDFHSWPGYCCSNPSFKRNWFVGSVALTPIQTKLVSFWRFVFFGAVYQNVVFFSRIPFRGFLQGSVWSAWFSEDPWPLIFGYSCSNSPSKRNWFLGTAAKTPRPTAIGFILEGGQRILGPAPLRAPPVSYRRPFRFSALQ